MSDASRADSPVVVSDATGVARRSLLKGTAGILAAGMFPAVHSQEKIVLRYLGTAVNQDKAIAEKFKADTGIEIQYIPVTTDEVTKRAVTAPNSFDLIDTEFFSLKKIVPTGNLGNASAALVAKRMGLPIGEIVLATNANDVLPRYFDGAD